MSKCVKCGNEILTGDIHWEMGLCNNCYNELYKDHKTHISLDKMWLELAIMFRDENDKLQSKIADLEAKLAEKDEEIEKLKTQRHIYLERSVEECNKITDLEFELQHHDQDKIELLEKILNLTDGRTYLAQYIKEQIEILRGKNEVD